ncbi:MAG: COX15/CtaA family protein [Rhodobacteraceae bacterium]|nr:COX15/CtaA family protein [Paracoccaceae bacterium]
MTANRNVFEEVGEKQPAPQVKKVKPVPRKALIIWLGLIFVLLVIIIAVGGMTRLTDSGLSITEWKPVTGVIPPLNMADWLEEFGKYQGSPEFMLQNSAMTLEEFKGIFWWEWGHRFLGRFIGLVWAVGFLWFLLRRQIPTGWTGRFLGLGVLGGLQGALGWWMVSSGLTGRMVDVASYRLALHLGLAFVILGLIAWSIQSLRMSGAEMLQARRRREGGLMVWAGILVAVLFAQVMLGGLVAGIDAGRSYPTWPDMAGEFMPSGSFDSTPLWANFFENPGLVQFNHRLMGYIAFILGVVVWWKSRKSPVKATRAVFSVMLAVMLAQVVLGIVTVLYMARMDIAITHQLGAVLLFVLVLMARFAAAYPAVEKVSRG